MLDQWFAQIFFFTSMYLRKKCVLDINPVIFLEYMSSTLMV